MVPSAAAKPIATIVQPYVLPSPLNLLFSPLTPKPLQLDLTYFCTCTSNHSAPALQYYSGSMINFFCHKSQGDCYASHANDLAGQRQCNVTFVCSDIKAEAQAASSSSASSSVASATATSSSTSSPSPSATKSAALRIGQDYGMGILAVAVLGSFGFAL